MSVRAVLVSGAGVAGLTMAVFLRRAGFEVDLIERSPRVRRGGYAIDFRGQALEVLDELGILKQVADLDTQMAGTAVVDGDGATVSELPAERFSGSLEVPKAAFIDVLWSLAKSLDISYRFGDSINALAQSDDAVTASFESSAPRRYDVVVGADGLYSATRRLTLDPKGAAIRHLGLSGVGFSTENFLGLDHRGLLQTTPGRAIYVFASDPKRLTVSLSFATSSPALDHCGRDEQDSAVRAAFAGHGWIAPRLLEAMEGATDFHFASSSQVILDIWHAGRVVLVGDAGYCAAPTSGTGTSQALLGARELSSRLAATPGDHAGAFTAYQAALRSMVKDNQARGAKGAFTFGAS